MKNGTKYYIYAAVSSRKQKTEAQGDFSQSVYRLLIVQTEIYRLPVC
jgi:hypothetical protein